MQFQTKSHSLLIGQIKKQLKNEMKKICTLYDKAEYKDKDKLIDYNVKICDAYSTLNSLPKLKINYK